MSPREDAATQTVVTRSTAMGGLPPRPNVQWAAALAGNHETATAYCRRVQRPHDVIDKFTTNFNALDHEALCALFAEGATTFWPYPPGGRVAGRSEIAEFLQRLTSDLRARGIDRLDLRPLDLRVETGSDLSFADFSVVMPDGRLGRRTIVLCRAEDRWMICHLHASNV